MKQPLVIRKRLPDGTFGEPQKAFEGTGDTTEEKAVRLEQENAELREQLNNGLMELSTLIAMVIEGGGPNV